MDSARTFAAFAGEQLIAQGVLREVLTQTKRKLDRDEAEQLLIFDEQSGRQVDCARPQ